MSANTGMTPGEASGKVCPVGPTAESHSYMRSTDFSAVSNSAGQYPTKVDGTSVARTWAWCQGDRCMMWTWNAGSTTHGYCGLRGKVVIP